jgi:hypothetical protein
MLKLDHILDQYIDGHDLVHAYGIEGSGDELGGALSVFLERKLGIVISGNPDVRAFAFEQLGIDGARMLITASLDKPLVGSRKYFLVSFTGVTREAQNALLKVLEEPAGGTHFFIIVPSFELLLPTVRSRLFLISCARQVRAPAENESRAYEFLKAAPARRLTLLKELVENKDRLAAALFLDELERCVAQSRGQNISLDHYRVLGVIEETREYLNDRAPSFKLLLEHLALTM